ncbi:MAG: RagB/SusD family nutrient uptake outer membrane protein [Ginsengibacter sp.]|jgi:hypothetical protein
MKKILLYLLPLSVILVTGCKKEYLDTKPSNGVPQSSILSTYGSITAALNGAYNEQFASGTGASTGHDNFGQKAFDLQLDLMGNDMVVHSQGYGWFNTDYQLTAWQSAATGQQSDNAWYMYYDLIKQANTILANIDGIKDATQSQKDAMKGEAYGMRAYCYYYLINLFQQTVKGNETKPGVPLYLDPSSLADLGRGTVADVYTQINKDLSAASTLLNGKTPVSKMNMSYKVVQGFIARVKLQQQDYPAAATAAGNALVGYTLMSGAALNARTAFSTASNSEFMWGSIIPENLATIYASFFSHMDAITRQTYAQLGTQKKITKDLFDQIPSTDVRKKWWTAPGSPNISTNNPVYNQVKYTLPTNTGWAADYEYMTVAEMYLIQAEALARQGGKDAQAVTVLETLIKTRNPAYSATGLTGTNLINEILLQRRIELWGAGFGLLDIKRLGQGLNRPTGPGNHGAPNFNPGVYTTSPQDWRFLMRIPQRELDNNSKMTPADQNPAS